LDFDDGGASRVVEQLPRASTPCAADGASPLGDLRAPPGLSMAGLRQSGYYHRMDWRLPAVLAVLGVSIPGCAVGAASLGHPLRAGSVNTETLHGRLVQTRERAADGTHSMKATYAGGGDNGYSREVVRVGWRSGDRVLYKAAFYLPRGFKDAMEGQVDLMRWDDFPDDHVHSDRGGIVIYHRDKQAYLIRQRLGIEQVALTGPISLPEGRWFRLEVRQRLGTHGARNAVYLNNRLAASSTRANTYGRRIRRVRFGLVAIAEGHQRLPLSLFFDSATVVARR
jgi:hypothetical protein